LIDIRSCKSSLKLDSSHSVDLEMLAEVQDHIGLEGNAPRGEALMDGLGGEADLAEDPELVPAVGELGVLQVSHLDAKVPHEVVVNQGGGWCWQVWGHEASKGSSFDTKDELFILVGVPVTRGRIDDRTGHHFENSVGSY